MAACWELPRAKGVGLVLGQDGVGAHFALSP